MTQSSHPDEPYRKALREHLAREAASGQPVDTSWTDDLPSDPLPEEEGETSVTFLTKREPTPPYAEVLKFDPNQPRNPKGTSTGGRWASGMQAVADQAEVDQAVRRGYVPGDAPGMSRQQGSASYADIMNAPMGTGFANTPRITGDPEMVKRLTTPATPSSSSALEALKTANISDAEQNSEGATNASYHVTMDDDNNTEAIAKPEVGETWTGSFTNPDISRYIKNRDFSLAEREAVAYEISEALKIGFVPATVHRDHLDLASHNMDEGGSGGSGYDSSDLRDMYDQYREKAQEHAMDAVSDEMGNLFDNAQQEHVQNIKDRANEVTDIWNELIDKEYPVDTDFAAQKEHPVLPMGSQPPFERRDPAVLDPLEVLDEAEVGKNWGNPEEQFSGPLKPAEEENVRAVLRKHLQEGVQELGDVDEEAAREHLDRDKWIEGHQDTENRLYESKIQTFNAWRQSQGYGSGGGGGNNDEAPHPDGASLQHFIANSTYGDISKGDRAKMAILDYVLGTMDRHGSNMMLATYPEDGLVHPVAIDNGYSMPASRTPDGFTFRSVAVETWRNSADKLVLKPLRDKTLQALEATDWKALIARHPSMNELEREALLGRVENMKTAMKYDAGLKDLWSGQQLMGHW